MSAMIVGGGIGGLATAIAFERAGFSSVVLEARDAQSRGSGGAFLNFAPNGVNVFRALGLAVDAIAAGYVSEAIEFSTASGRRLGRIDNADYTERFGAPSLMIRRSELHRILIERCNQMGEEVRYGRRVQDFDEHDNGVTVRFDDGTTATGSVIVAADGAHSQLRALLNSTNSGLEYLGQIDVAGFSTAPPDAVLGSQQMFFCDDGFFGYFCTPMGQAWSLANIPEPTAPVRGSLEAVTSSEWLHRVRHVVRDAPARVRCIVETSEAPVGAWPLTDLDTIDTWHTDRVCLIGDAAHATSPSAGQGASLALEDAVAIAHHLTSHDTPAVSFVAFERERRQRVEQLIKVARRNTSTKAPGPIGRILRDLVLPSFLRIGAKATEVAYDYTPPALTRPALDEAV